MTESCANKDAAASLVWFVTNADSQKLEAAAGLLPTRTAVWKWDIAEHRAALSAPTVNAPLADLENLGIVEEATGRKRSRIFGYRKYLAILSEGTDPLPATC